MTTPRYLRFARALALCSSLATLPACPSAMTGTDAGDEPDVPSSGTDAPVATDTPVATDAPEGEDAPAMTDGGGEADVGELADAGEPQDAGDACSTCACFGLGEVDAGLPGCETVGLDSCCFAVGPLAPPDLPA
jgi:hypothetical protein